MTFSGGGISNMSQPYPTVTRGKGETVSISGNISPPISLSPPSTSGYLGVTVRPPTINISPLPFFILRFFIFLFLGLVLSPPRGGSFPQFNYPLNIRIPPRISKFLYIFSECNVKIHGLCSNRETGHSGKLG